MEELETIDLLITIVERDALDRIETLQYIKDDYCMQAVLDICDTYLQVNQYLMDLRGKALFNSAEPRMRSSPAQ